MTGSELGFIALRLVGLLMIVMAVVGGISGLSFFGWPSLSGEEGYAGGFYFLAHWVVLGIGGYLLVSARQVSEKLFSSAEGRLEGVSAQAAQAIAFSVLGVYLVTLAVPSLAVLLARLVWALRGGAELERQEFFGDNLFTILEVLVQLAVGMFLFLRAEGLSAYWRRLRDGRDREAS